MSDTNGKVPRKTVRQKIMEVLSDGFPHPREELHACLWDELAEKTTIQQHISDLRKVLNPKGEDITFFMSGGVGYYEIRRLVASPYNGHR